MINQQYNDFTAEFKGAEAIITPEELKSIFSYVADMESSLKNITAELEVLKKRMNVSEIEKQGSSKLQEAAEGKKEFIVQLKVDFAGKKESFVTDIQETVQEMKLSLLSRADDIKQCVHDKNLEGLNSIIESLHIKEMCEQIKELITKGMEKIKNVQEKTDFVGNELGQVKGHLKSIKDMSASNMKFERIEFKKIKNGLDSANDVLTKMQEKTVQMEDKIDNLKNKVELSKKEGQEKQKEIISRKLRLKTDNTLKLC